MLSAGAHVTKEDAIFPDLLNNRWQNSEKKAKPGPLEEVRVDFDELPKWLPDVSIASSDKHSANRPMYVPVALAMVAETDLVRPNQTLGRRNQGIGVQIPYN